MEFIYGLLCLYRLYLFLLDSNEYTVFSHDFAKVYGTKFLLKPLSTAFIGGFDPFLEYLWLATLPSLEGGSLPI